MFFGIDDEGYIHFGFISAKTIEESPSMAVDSIHLHKVGHTAQQTIEIANGGFMAMRVDWALARPPRQFSARLAVGSLNRLSDRLISEIHDWAVHVPATHSSPSCPFRVEPNSVTIKPFTRQKFTFTFYGHGPVGAQSSVFAYLVARDLPDSTACILHYKKLLELQSEMQPEGLGNVWQVGVTTLISAPRC